MALSLLSYVANIIILLIKGRILTKGHLCFNLVIQQDKLELKEAGSSRLLAEW
jgi:hypothetical protein